ncbi:hypothetical protein, partial [Streptomyces brasiliscabiei]|uniref:hypothetical protein n=1 Tax=Streptomyces brasiliscabiei TaxID=2736302 RepID=UPI0030141ED7
ITLLLLPLPLSAQPFNADTYEQPCAAQYNKALYPDLARLAPPEAPAATRSALRAVVVRTLTWKPGELIKVCFRSGTQAAR